MPTPTVTATVRLAPEELARADRLLSALVDHPDLRATRLTRSVVIRLAILRGLDALEAEHDVKPTSKRRKS